VQPKVFDQGWSAEPGSARGRGAEDQAGRTGQGARAGAEPPNFGAGSRFSRLAGLREPGHSRNGRFASECCTRVPSGKREQKNLHRGQTAVRMERPSPRLAGFLLRLFVNPVGATPSRDGQILFSPTSRLSLEWVQSSRKTATWRQWQVATEDAHALVSLVSAHRWLCSWAKRSGR
jgi:hypothetical protein